MSTLKQISISCAGGFVTSLPVFASGAPQAAPDTIARQLDLEAVVIHSTHTTPAEAVGKGALASLDEYLQRLPGVEMIKRGGYAWEPVVNSMQTERISTTIDGMKIFSACTDRMDPVTAYVETGNLQQINLKSGLDGNPQATSNLGGSIDLRLRKAGFDTRATDYTLAVGGESNGRLQVYEADAELSRARFYSNFGLSRRHAGNYKSGGGTEVLYSQFTKLNAFANLGWQPQDGHILEGTFIYDRATDVGYPALRMDVSSAEGLITSLSYRRERMRGWFTRSETKVYYNHITHNMDDTHRPKVVIHMDMPGRSTTAGAYSLLQGSRGRHSYQLNYDLYYNNLYADMTMYPKGGAPMFMMTWPDVTTLNTGLLLSDNLRLGADHSLRLAGKVSLQRRHIDSREGYDALHIYFSDLERSAAQADGHLSLSYAYSHGPWQADLGLGAGSRTPTVTEQYGYFLNNIFDQYDYMGNPHLKNESAVEASAALARHGARWNIKVTANYFRLSNYIIGVPEERLSSMTLGAAGVKIYRNLHDARIANATLRGEYTPWAWLRTRLEATYAYGKESTGARLPLIAPLTARPAVETTWRSLQLEAGGTLAARHDDYSAKYGETPTAGYAVFHLHLQWAARLWHRPLTLRGGVENLLDHDYTTYSDWNHIAQKGRSYFLNATITL